MKCQILSAMLLLVAPIAFGDVSPQPPPVKIAKKAAYVSPVASPAPAKTTVKPNKSKFQIKSEDGTKLYYNVDQVVQVKDGKIIKDNEYFTPEKTLAQKEHVEMNAETFQLLVQDFENYELGATIKVKANGDLMDIEVVTKKGEKPKRGEIKWTPNMMYAKAMEYYMVRNWDTLMAKKPLEMDLLVAAQHRVVSFSLTNTGEKDGLTVLKLQPSSFFIRQFVGAIDFYFKMGPEPKLVKYIGRTTIPIKGNGDARVRIDFE